MTKEKGKYLGQIFTPARIASALVRWAVRNDRDQLVDPSCGDGQFLVWHQHSTGVEIDKEKATVAQERAPSSTVVHSDFFEWASSTVQRFDAAVGNPPFIRYQHFSGHTRRLASSIVANLGVHINGLASSWALFIVAAAGLLKHAGRMAFVVPAEIGHAPYASPVIRFLCSHFDRVRIVAVREKLFPDLSEAAWILSAEGFGGRTETIEFSLSERFDSDKLTESPRRRVAISSWLGRGCRLRKYILPEKALAAYESCALKPGVIRLGELATTTTGYVSGANDFFHLKPSDIERFGIPNELVRIAVRRSSQLRTDRINREVVRGWLTQDAPVMLLDLSRREKLPSQVIAYLNSRLGQSVRDRYKCRHRDPWYVIPDIRVPDAFLSYMSGLRPSLVRNEAGCVCTNSLHGVFMKTDLPLSVIQQAWNHPLIDVSCELEGHPLGGGMLKLEPREAANLLIPLNSKTFTRSEIQNLKESADCMRRWRYYVKEIHSS